MAAPVTQDGRPGPVPAGLGTTVVRAACMLAVHWLRCSVADARVPLRLVRGELQTIGLMENGRIDYSTVTCFRVRLRLRDALSLTLRSTDWRVAVPASAWLVRCMRSASKRATLRRDARCAPAQQSRSRTSRERSV